MSVERTKSSAPLGTTHYLPEQIQMGWPECWYKVIEGSYYIFDECSLEELSEWVLDPSDPSEFSHLLILLE